MKCSWSTSELNLQLDDQVSDDLIMHLNGCNPFCNGENITALRTHIDRGDAFRYIHQQVIYLFVMSNSFKVVHIQLHCSSITRKIGNGKIPITIGKRDDILDIDCDILR